MGNWHIAIDGHGVHDNGLDHDAEQRLKDFVHQLLADGHHIHRATITVGSGRELVPASQEHSAFYKNLP
jgi:hypothetical protein